MHGLRVATLVLVCWIGLGGTGAAHAQALEQARQLQQAGAWHQAAARARLALEQASTAGERRQAAALQAELLLQLGQAKEAEAAVALAIEGSNGAERAAALLLAAQLAQARGDTADARRQLEAVLATDPQGPQGPQAQRAALNLARLAPPTERGQGLQALAASLHEAPLLLDHARQARATGLQALAERSARQALAGATPRQRAEALDLLAGLAEQSNRPDEALRLNAEALALLPPLPESLQTDLRVSLEWRLARLQPAGAARLAAYQRAVAQLEAVRADWPLEAEDGGSSQATLFEPLYLGYVDALLRRAAAQGDAQPLLARARDALEQLRQAELQDYLGDRCEVDAVKGGSPAGLPPGAAAIYPVLLADRVELLVEDARGLWRRGSPAQPAAVREAALQLARLLRERSEGWEAPARQLHAALLAPLQDELAARGVQTLVWVSDGPLRLVPMAALQAPEQSALGRWQQAAALGLSMTNTQGPGAAEAPTLVAGAGRFGPVVDRLADEAWAQPLRRQMLGAAAEAPGSSRSLQAARLRDALELPGVSTEVAKLGALMKTKALRDAGFTVRRFGQEVQAGGYRVVHIASHGVFGGSAASSYLLAYDDLLTLGDLQGLLQSDATRKRPIELLSLSACQTAEGNERAPLGIAGAAIKARARAVLGTLWPVDDAATVKLMETFYRGWAQQGLSKAAALREAQLALQRDPETRHPYYWAPFALIGNWQ